MKEDRGGKVFVASTRVGGATVVAAYSPRVRPGVPVSFPVGWADLDAVTPADFTVHTALDRLGAADPWRAENPAPQRPPPHPSLEGPALSVGCQASPKQSQRAVPAPQLCHL